LRISSRPPGVKKGGKGGKKKKKGEREREKHEERAKHRALPSVTVCSIQSALPRVTYLAPCAVRRLGRGEEEERKKGKRKKKKRKKTTGTHRTCI